MENRLRPELLQGLVAQIRAAVTPIDSPRPLGAECQNLSDAFTLTLWQASARPDLARPAAEATRV